VFADHRGFNSEFPWSHNPNDHDYDLSLPNVEAVVGSMLGLPNHPGMESEDVKYVIETVRAFDPESD
jgi:dTDP-4-amino-4,6-dideoxygalactose transaminase